MHETYLKKKKKNTKVEILMIGSQIPKEAHTHIHKHRGQGPTTTTTSSFERSPPTPPNTT
jgi:hypothetical protein